jgi:hypothetical protein
MRKFEGLSWDERAVVLAKRLIPDLPRGSIHQKLTGTG